MPKIPPKIGFLAFAKNLICAGSNLDKMCIWFLNPVRSHEIVKIYLL